MDPLTEPRTIDAMPLVLVVEDEPELAELLEDYLHGSGHRTERAADGEQALTLFRAARPDLILLDIALPKLDGTEVLKRVRLESTVPIIMLTAKAEEVDKIVGLELGADDYVTKPFRPREVMARVKAALRRAHMGEPDNAPLRIGPLEIDAHQGLATANGQRLVLTATEFRLLLHLAQYQGRICDRAELLEAVLPESDALERVIDVHIANLRKKLDAQRVSHMLQTVRGMGFRLEP